MRLVLVVVLVMIASLAVRAEEIARASVSDWVEMLPVPEDAGPGAGKSSEGFHFLLRDIQIRWIGETREAAYRRVWKIDGRSGLDQGGTVQFPFDPLSETLVLNRVDILRDGARIDQRDAAAVGIYRREDKLDVGVVDGRLTLHLEVPGLQIGDVVDVALTRTTGPGMAMDGFTGMFELGLGIRTVQSRLLLHWPKPLPFHVALHHPQELNYTESDEGATVRREWRRGDLPVLPPEEGAPPGHYALASVEFGPHADWAPIVAAFLPYYGQVPPLPAIWQDRAAAIAAASPDPARRTIDALRLVQGDIRYASNAVGPGAYFARDPAETLRTLYGDCKDKAVLLTSLLSALGIEAQVALASLADGYGLDNRLPTLGAFDHMIVRARVGDEWHWMDPTASNEGGTLQTAAVPDYGFALPIAPGVADLVAIVLTPASRSRVELMSTYSFGGQGLRLGMRTIYSGASANWARGIVASTPAEAILAGSLDRLAQTYPGIAAEGLPVVADDTRDNTLAIDETYFIAQDSLTGLMQSFPFVGWGFTDLFPAVSGVGRRAPLAVFHPYEATVGVLVIGAPVDFEPPQPVVLENSAFAYRFGAATLMPGQMSLTWSYTSKARSIPAPMAEAVLRDARKTEEFLAWWFDLRIPEAAEIFEPGADLLPP